MRLLQQQFTAPTTTSARTIRTIPTTPRSTSPPPTRNLSNPSINPTNQTINLSNPPTNSSNPFTNSANPFNQPSSRFARVGLNKLPRLVGLPYEIYMFFPILTDMFNHWFVQGAIPGSVTKGMIILLKKGSRHVWEGLDDYRFITLLITELKFLANRLEPFISDLIGSELNYAVKGR